MGEFDELELAQKKLQGLMTVFEKLMRRYRSACNGKPDEKILEVSGLVTKIYYAADAKQLRLAEAQLKMVAVY